MKDCDTLDDVWAKDLHVQNVLPLTHPGSQFLLYAFEWPLCWWKRLIPRLAFFGSMPLEPGKAKYRFGAHFQIESISGETDFSTWPPGYAVYLMPRKHEGQA